jgi:Tfp pilus assembly protein PilV
MNKIVNNRGMSLVGVMISAAIGLMVVLGFSKALMNFSEQTSTTNRTSLVSQAGSNLNMILRSNKAWSESVNKTKSSCKYPGEKNGCTFALYRKGKRYTCTGASYNRAIGFMTVSGSLVDDINCSKCKSDVFCGLNPRSHFKFEIYYKNPPNPAQPKLMPDFAAQMMDPGGTKKVTNVDITGDDAFYIDPETFKCTNGQHLVGVNKDGSAKCVTVTHINPATFKCPRGQHVVGVNPDGSAKCEQTYKNIDCSGGGQVLVGIKSNGQPDCRTLTPPTISVSSCPGGKLMAGISNNSAICRTDQKGGSAPAPAPSGPSCSGTGTKQ